MQAPLNTLLQIRSRTDHGLANGDPTQFHQAERIRAGVLDKRVDALGLVQRVPLVIVAALALVAARVVAIVQVLVQIDHVIELLLGPLSPIRAIPAGARVVQAVGGPLHIVVRIVDKVRVLQILCDPRLHLAQVEAGHDTDLHELQVLC